MSRWWVLFLMVIAALTAVFIIGNQVTAVNPAWPEARAGEFGTGLYRFEHDGQRLALDFQNAVRLVDGE